MFESVDAGGEDEVLMPICSTRLEGIRDFALPGFTRGLRLLSFMLIS